MRRRNRKVGLAKSSAVMAAGTMVSRMLGSVRTIMLVAALGTTGIAAEAFNVANTIPNNLNNIIAGGLLNAILVPQIVRAARRKDGGREYTDKLLTVAGAILLIITTVMTLGASVLTALFIDVQNPRMTALAVSLAVWCIPETFFYGMYTLFGQILNARGNFGPYMWAPTLNNIVSIIGFGAFIFMFGRWRQNDPWTDDMTMVLGATALGGVAAQALILIIPLWRSGFRWRPQFGIRGMGFRRAGRVAGWTFAAIMVGQVGYLVVTRVASAAQDVAENVPSVPGFTAYTNAFMLYMLPHSLVTVSITTAIFTRLSNNAADNRRGRVRKDLSLSLRMIGLFSVFASAAMCVLAYPLVRTMIPTASPVGARTVSSVLAMMSIGLVAFGFWSVGQRVFYAFEDARTLFFIQVPMALVVIATALASRYFLDVERWVPGIGIGMTLSNLLGAALVLTRANRLLWGIDGKRIFLVMIRAVMATTAAVLAGWLVRGLFTAQLETEGVVGWVFNMAALGCSGLVMVLVYAAGLWALRVRELHGIVAMIRRRLPRRLGGRR